GAESGVVIWSRPRLEADARQPVLLRDVRGIAELVRREQSLELARTADHLRAIASGRSDSEAEQIDQQPVNEVTRRWAGYVGLSQETDLAITGHMPNRQSSVSGYAALNGWSVDNSASLLTNTSTEPITFLTLTVPARGVTVHPWPQLDAIVSWKSPVTGAFTIQGLAADADNKCGNGAAWRLELRRSSGVAVLASGEFDSGGRNEFQVPGEQQIHSGDIVSLIINARHQDHACDTTHVQLTLTEVGADNRRWDLSEQIVDRIGEGNPLADLSGHPAVWHFHTASADGSRPVNELPPDSLLAQWKAAVIAEVPTETIIALEQRVAETLNAPPGTLPEADQLVADQIRAWFGPLGWV
ncbi:MAG: hypothetical protein KDA85_12550, partial [Planctomycetaceae bacterium]|nr:hypothetical protein [Planctomycetaceae bacterium]